MPFLLFANIHSAGSHLSSPLGLSSKIVPSFTENCRPHSRHFQMRRVLRKPGFPASQAGGGEPLRPRPAGGEGRGGILLGGKPGASGGGNGGRFLVFPHTKKLRG